MTATRRAWWSRARWFILLYLLVASVAIFAAPRDVVMGGWRLGLLVSVVTALIGTLGTLRVVMGHGSYHLLFVRLERLGTGGIVLFEVAHGMWVFWLAAVTGDLHLIARGATHVALAVSVGLAYLGRPVRAPMRRGEA